MTEREVLQSINGQLIAMEANMLKSIDMMKDAIAKSEHVRLWVTNTLNTDKENILGGD